jgi:hypothetical protein
MSSLRDTALDYENGTLAYLDQLDRRAADAITIAEDLPLPLALRLELQQTWRITRQKLAYFRREFLRAEGETREELDILHSLLLPDVIDYQIKIGAMMIEDNCGETEHLFRWRKLWTNLSEYLE